MELTNLSKQELLGKCVELGFTKCKSKNKDELIELIYGKSKKKTKIEFIIKDDDNKNVSVPDLTETAQNIKYIDLCCGIGGFRLALNNFQKDHPNYRFVCVLSVQFLQYPIFIGVWKLQLLIVQRSKQIIVMDY
jgi:hypothetical protein